MYLEEIKNDSILRDIQIILYYKDEIDRLNSQDESLKNVKSLLKGRIVV